MADQQSDDETVIRPRRAPVPALPVEPDVADTVVRLIEPAAPAPRAFDGRAGGESTDADADAEPGESIAWAVNVLGTATVVPLDRPLVVGRRPGVARVSEHPEPRRLVLPPDRADVSSRHARLEQLGDTLVVTDLGSTNGTVVHWSSGASRRLRPGESCAVLPDARVELGDGVVIEFVRADITSPPDFPNPEPPS